MIIPNTIIRPNGDVEVVDAVVAENYFEASPAPQPTAEERISALETLVLELGGVI